MKLMTLIITLVACISQAQAGYYLNTNQKKMFSEGRVSAAHHVNRNRAIDAIEDFLIKSGLSTTPQAAGSEATSIFDTANTVGIDPMFLVVTLRDNYYLDRVVTRRSDRYPLTRVSVNELRSQYGAMGANHAAGMDTLMKEQLVRRFNNSKESADFLRSLQVSTGTAQTFLRNNPSFAIFSIAQILKILISKDVLMLKTFASKPPVSYANAVRNPVPQSNACLVVELNRRKDMVKILKELAPLSKAINCGNRYKISELYKKAL